ncbi:hypothetical protein FN846DRAFT_885979 [Sphaerosporella brunnea]|uniref:Uncharacterized protein n=1 Tax=Sphaerosporella brunnea TaxID=1250544 RepID=A0A5J5FBJ3_9PEZI|nr:hypothetical protein FN846DRAFT_885979 [Sphaerosporella brunnea]
MSSRWTDTAEDPAEAADLKTESARRQRRAQTTRSRTKMLFTATLLSLSLKTRIRARALSGFVYLVIVSDMVHLLTYPCDATTYSPTRDATTYFKHNGMVYHHKPPACCPPRVMAPSPRPESPSPTPRNSPSPGLWSPAPAVEPSRKRRAMFQMDINKARHDGPDSPDTLAARRRKQIKYGKQVSKKIRFD